MDDQICRLHNKSHIYNALNENIRSQHTLEKVGFRFIGEDETFKYYRIEQ